jgi:hypothetical protein
VLTSVFSLIQFPSRSFDHSNRVVAHIPAVDISKVLPFDGTLRNLGSNAINFPRVLSSLNENYRKGGSVFFSVEIDFEPFGTLLNDGTDSRLRVHAVSDARLS